MGSMKHFSAIQSLCRIGLEDGNPLFRRQVERLRDRLRKDGSNKEAGSLDRLLNADEKEASLTPSRVELSRSFLRGEKLSESTLPPTDRESSAPIADIFLAPHPEPMPPTLPTGIHSAVDALIEEWRSGEALSEMGLTPAYSCLIFGPPGTGKTLTGFYIAEQLGLPLVRARIDSLVSSFLGTTARNLGNLFDFSNRYQCVLLLDEFDALAKLRDDPHEVGEIKRVVNTLLQNLDQRSGVGLTIAITNHPDLLDTAVWRRFDTRLELPLPAADQRMALLNSFMGPVSLPDDFSKFMVWLSEGFSGSDLRSMIDNVKRHIALNGNGTGEPDWFEALTAFAARNSGGGRDQRTRTLLEGAHSIASMLDESVDPSFTQREIGNVLSKDQATISRWTSGKKRGEMLETNKDA